MSILDNIIATKRQEIAGRKKQRPVELLKEEISALGRPRNFFQAVTHKNPINSAKGAKGAKNGKPLNLIAEIKKASPSAGVIRADFDPVEIARIYTANGADALSVLTDEHYFQGHLDYIHAVRDAVHLPMLRKDFIIDPYRVYKSRAAGADAMLLIAECLEMGQLIDLQILATEVHMTVLIEVRDLSTVYR